MKSFQNKKLKAVLILFILLAVAAGTSFFFIKPDNADSTISIENDNVSEKKPEITGIRPDKVLPQAGEKVTEEKLRKKYGRIEIIELFNGQKYSGAVISTGDIYVLETVHGRIEIPAEKVRVRNIIR